MPALRTLSIAGILVVVGIGIAGGIAYWKWTRSPTYSLLQVRSAFASRDTLKFEKHVDVAGVASRMIDDVLADVADDMPSAANSAESLGASLAQGFIELIKPRLVEMAREQMLRAVEDGAWNPGTALTGAGEIPIEAFTEKFSGLAAIQNVSYTRREGKIALVGLEVQDTRLDADLILELKMRDMGGYWQVVELANLAEFIDRLNQLTEARLVQINAPIRAQLSGTLSIAEIRHRRWSDGWGITKQIIVDATLKNESKSTIDSVEGSVSFSRADGAVLHTFAVEESNDIQPGGVRRSSWRVDVGYFDETLTNIYDTPAAVTSSFDVTSVAFNDGGVIRIAEKLPAPGAQPPGAAAAVGP